MIYGLTADEHSFLEEQVIALLKEKGASVFLFGSRARGTQEKFSDIDLLVESKSDLSSLISLISERLEESNFPYKVDIVQGKYLANSYRTSVEKDKIAL